MQEGNAGVSLASLNAVSACEQAYEFEYISPDGSSTGIFFSVLGGQSDAVVKGAAKIINERRRKQAVRELNKLTNRKNQVEFDTLESDVEFGQRLAAVRLVGWRGITDPYTPENALLLCQTNRFVAAAVMEASDDMANFMRL